MRNKCLIHTAILLYTCMVAATGCKPDSAPIIDEPEVYPEDAITVICRIRFFSGNVWCRDYFIEIENDDNGHLSYWMPHNLPDEFEISNLKVKVTYQVMEERYRCDILFYPVIHILKIEKI